LAVAGSAAAQSVSLSIDTSDAGRRQVIDGFGTTADPGVAGQSWYQQLYLDDAKLTLLAVVSEVSFASPYSDNFYVSPWYPPAAIQLPGPDMNNVRTYTSVADYGRVWGGLSAPIAVMGPDIDQNVKLLDFSPWADTAALVQKALANRAALGDFKVIWENQSPPPWVKIASGNGFDDGVRSDFPPIGTPFPFIWYGFFGGGVLDVSNTPIAAFNDGTGPTSALTQFARSMAAYARGLQNFLGVPLYAISLQREIAFESFYPTCLYDVPHLVAALKAVRAELDKYPDLKAIQLIGPEDSMIDSSYSLWSFGPTAKSLQLVAGVAADPQALTAMGFFALETGSYGSNPIPPLPDGWDRWANGWTAMPAPGLPDAVSGFTAYGKKSWVLREGGEQHAWLAPVDDAGTPPNQGAWGEALAIHFGLVVGQQSGWFSDGFADGDPTNPSELTDPDAGAGSPKLVALKHFSRFIRPGAVRVSTTVTGAGSSSVLASAYVHDANGTLTVVLIKDGTGAADVTIHLPPSLPGLGAFAAFTSSDYALWQSTTPSIDGGVVTVSVPGYGIATLYAAPLAPKGPGMFNAGCGCSTGPVSLTGLLLAFAALLRTRPKQR
jgi:MYXO-CTERM domain-containing protein